MKSGFSIGAKIQLAILMNIILAVLIGEYLVVGMMGLVGTKAVIVNLAINSAIAVIYGLIVSRAITKALREQLQLLKTMAAGKGDLTQRLAAETSDEVGELSSCFNAFVQHLQDIMLNVANSTHALASSVEYFKHMGEDITKGVLAQTQQTEHIVNEIATLASHVESISTETQKANEIACESEENAVRGGNIVQRTIQGMQEAAVTVDRSAETLQSFKSSVDTVGDMVGTINDIADQTNLLALNAAIEAARAGENGRGFAVVADEVRALAVRTAGATQDINHLIQNIQTDLGGIVELMNAGVKQVNQGVELSSEAGDTLEDIVRLSQRVAQMIEGIASEAANQSAITGSISKTVEEVASVAQQNGKSVEQVVRFSEDLHNQTEAMKAVVGEFTLEK